MKRHVASGPNTYSIGSEIMALPSGSEPWKLIAVRAVLVTSAVSGNRIPSWQVVDQSGTIMWKGSTGLVASVSDQFEMVLDATAMAPVTTVVNYGNTSVISGPQAWWPAGWTLETSTNGMQSGDQYTDVAMTYLQADTQDWLEIVEAMSARKVP